MEQKKDCSSIPTNDLAKKYVSKEESNESDNNFTKHQPFKSA
jgi:hypothetical protein